MQHDADIREFEIDEQSTVWVMTCRRCHRRAKPVFRKDEVEKCLTEDSCPGEKIETDYNETGYKACLDRCKARGDQPVLSPEAGQFLRNAIDYGVEAGIIEHVGNSWGEINYRFI